MDNRPVARRRLLQWTASGVGVAALAACTGPPDPGPTPVTTAPPSTAPVSTAPHRTTAATPPSTFPAAAPRWNSPAPSSRVPDGGGHPLDCGHSGCGGAPTTPLLCSSMNWAATTGGSSRARGSQGPAAPSRRRRDAFRHCAVDGGDTWWHARADGSDTQSMLVKEFVPFLGALGYDIGRIGLFGISMGGFGALLLASQARMPGIRAVAAMSPAVWDSYDARMERAFDSPADFAAHDVFALRPKLAATPKRIDCGTGDELYATVRDYVRGCPPRSREDSSPAATMRPTGGPSCPRCSHFLGHNLA